MSTGSREEVMKLLGFVDILHDAASKLSRGVNENIRQQIQALDVGDGKLLRSYVGEKIYGSPNPPIGFTGIEDLFFRYCFDNQEIAQFFGIRANSDFSVLKFVPGKTTVNEIQERRVCSITGTDNIKLVYRNLAEVLGLNTFTCDASPWMHEILDPKGHRRTVGTLLDSSNGVSSRPGVTNINGEGENHVIRNYLSGVQGVTMQVVTGSKDEFAFYINAQGEKMNVTAGPSLNNILDNLNKGCTKNANYREKVIPKKFGDLLIKTCSGLKKNEIQLVRQVDILNRILLDLKTLGDAEQVNMSGGKIDVFITVDKLSAIRAALSGYFKLSIFTSNRNTALFFINPKAGLTPEQIVSNELKSTAKTLFESCKKTADYYFNARSNVVSFFTELTSARDRVVSFLEGFPAVLPVVKDIVLRIINKKALYYQKVYELLIIHFPAAEEIPVIPSWVDRTDADYRVFIDSSERFMEIMQPIRNKIYPYMQLFDKTKFEDLFGFVDNELINGINNIFTNREPNIPFLKQADSSINEHVEIFDIYNFGIHRASYIATYGLVAGGPNYLEYGLNEIVEPIFEFRKNKITLGSKITILGSQTGGQAAIVYQNALIELGLLFKFYAIQALHILNYYITAKLPDEAVLIHEEEVSRQLSTKKYVNDYINYQEVKDQNITTLVDANADSVQRLVVNDILDISVYEKEELQNLLLKAWNNQPFTSDDIANFKSLVTFYLPSLINLDKNDSVIYSPPVDTLNELEKGAFIEGNTRRNIYHEKLEHPELGQYNTLLEKRLLGLSGLANTGPTKMIPVAGGGRTTFKQKLKVTIRRRASLKKT